MISRANTVSSLVLWLIWKLRNEIYFQGATWTGMKRILLQIRQDAKALDTNVQAGDGDSNGRLRTTTGYQRKLAA